MSSTFTVWLGRAEAIPYWIFAIVVFFVYSPLTWIRTVEQLSGAYVFSMAMIALAIITTSVYAIGLIQENDGEHGPDYVPVNN